jgi:hypothetical protein
MKYDVFVQGSFYKTVELNTKNVAEVFSIVGKDVADGLTSGSNIKIVPVVENSSQIYSNGSFVQNNEDGTIQKLYKNQG